MVVGVKTLNPQIKVDLRSERGRHIKFEAEFVVVVDVDYF